MQVNETNTVEIQSKPVFPTHFFAAQNGKKEPIVRKCDKLEKPGVRINRFQV